MNNGKKHTYFCTFERVKFNEPMSNGTYMIQAYSHNDAWRKAKEMVYNLDYFPMGIKAKPIYMSLRKVVKTL